MGTEVSFGNNVGSAGAKFVSVSLPMMFDDGSAMLWDSGENVSAQRRVRGSVSVSLPMMFDDGSAMLWDSGENVSA